MAMADVNKTSLVVIFFLTMMTFLGGFAAAYSDAALPIGFDDNWITNFGNFDYKLDLEVGDSVMFCFEGLVDDVREVTQQDYDSCNGTSPIATYNYGGGLGTGCDIITFQRAGHHYFICGHPGHCEAGQKIDLLVNPAGPSIPSSTNPPASAPLPPPQSYSTSSSTATATSFSLYFTSSLPLLLAFLLH